MSVRLIAELQSLMAENERLKKVVESMRICGNFHLVKDGPRRTDIHWEASPGMGSAGCDWSDSINHPELADYLKEQQ